MSSPSTPCIGFSAPSGTGKTTLLRKLIKVFKEDYGLKIGIIKTSHHDFEIDYPGKDSYELRKAGACTTVITSPYRQVIIHEKTVKQNSLLEEQLKAFEDNPVDLILVEGFTDANIPKLELSRKETEKPLRLLKDPNLIAVATNSIDLHAHLLIKLLDIDNPLEIAEFLINFIPLSNARKIS